MKLWPLLSLLLCVVPSCAAPPTTTPVAAVVASAKIAPTGAVAARDVALNGDDLPVPIAVGKGSYASRPPRDQAARPGVQGQEGWGDLSQVFTHMKLWVSDDYKGPIPSTDWWTSLITRQWSGQLWAYPSMLRAESNGLAISYPKKWVLSGNKSTMDMESASRLLVRGKGFAPSGAYADSWSDWLVSFKMPQSPQKFIKVTMGHGLPCTWIESGGVDLRVDAENPTWFDAAGADVKLPSSGTALGVETNGDCYGIFAPKGTKFSMDGGSLAIEFAGEAHWISVALLPARTDLKTFAPYAPVVPRATKVAWNYSPKRGELTTNWTLQTENLAGEPNLDVIQGWIPHHYDTAKGTKAGFDFDGLTYATPRGLMKCASGRSFQISYPFRGLLPELPAPGAEKGMPNPYRPAIMKSLLDGYTDVTGYGSETYWGGKKILLYAKYMEMAYQTGQTQDAAIFQGKLREALVDWATYRPGEREHFFAMYPNWGSLVGFRTRDNQNPGIDVLQDHAFCYGYHVYAASLLAIHDPNFARDYGEMATLMVKDYANWDEKDTRFPTFRSFDPWAGHSYSGGTGSDKGNGQESSSESMQAWGAMFTLGNVLNNREMRDAGVFGYVSESRGVAEYWFDRDHENMPKEWPHAYNSNLESSGIGWWTWFSGDEFWMHSIQWLPMSPLLKYLSEDPEFARWDYQTMWKNKTVGGFDTNLGNEAGVGNVTLSYLQIFNPDRAAAVFDDLWDNNKATAHAKDESGPTYYRIHAGRSLGTIDWNSWTDIPTSTVYRNAAGQAVVAVYNTSGQDQACNLYENGKKTATFTVPARRLLAWTAGDKTPVAPLTTVLAAAQINPPAPVAVAASAGAPVLTRIEVSPATALMSDKTTQQFSAQGFDQFGKPFAVAPKWSVVGKGTIDQNGLYTPDKTSGGGNWLNAHFDIVASAGGVDGAAWAAVEESRRVAKINLLPAPPALLKMAAGASTQFGAEATDQFDARYLVPVKWSATGNVQISPDGRLSAGTPGDGAFTVEADGQTITVPVKVLSPDQVNLATMKGATASSSINDGSDARAAVDGNDKTRWESAHSDPQSITVDLETVFALKKIVLNWENAAGKVYDIELSQNGTDWTSAAHVDDGKPGVSTFDLNGAKARYIRVSGTQRTTGYGYSLYEIEAYGMPS